jgi:phosphonate transport system permease protein
MASARERFPEVFSTPPKIVALRALSAVVFVGLIGWCLVAFDVTPQRLVDGIAKLGHVLSLMLPPSLDPQLLADGTDKILETVAMALLGTVLAGIVAVPLGFLGARTILRLEFLRLGVRRGFDIVRAFEQLVIALILIRAFGLGPFAGILAIAISDIGTLAKLVAEAVENVSSRPVEGLRAAGGSETQAIRYAVLPQVLPVIISNLLYQLESNTRSATILGIVGAGGIGFLMDERIRGFYWSDVATLSIMLIVAVAIVDAISARLRLALIGRTTVAA